MSRFAVPDRRVVFDFEIEFANGGGIQGQDFRLDLEGPEIDDRAVADRIVADLRLLMVSAVRIRNARVIEEPHKRTVRASGMEPGTIVELSHVIRDGMQTYPRLPGPAIGTHLSREDSRAHYAAGTEFHIGTISMVANTGTYLDTPFHRYADGTDLAGLAASACVAVEGVVVRVPDCRAIGVDALADVDTWHRAVLFHTGWDRHFGTPAYAIDAPFVTEAAARRLVEGGATLVGIDSVNIDDISGSTRPAHSTLLAHAIPIVEHLTGLERLPDRGFELTAVPPKVEGLGTFPVRAVARITA
jgi:kynurenine formamidase